MPTICVDQSTAPAHSLFNPNEWRRESKALVSSCAAQFGLLLYTVAHVREECARGARVCGLRFEDLRMQWRQAQWDVSRGRYLVEVPAVHLHIQAFLAVGKTLLDLLAQLVSTERLVTTKVHGFHKKGSVIGGELLYTLTNKASAGREAQAAELRAFLVQEKAAWIDCLVKARDDLAHPQRGMYQVLWDLELAASGHDLKCARTVLPCVGGLAFDLYIEKTMGAFEKMAATFLRLIAQPPAD
jgi:hypothetical protein